jgi:hypothetical protein
MLLARNKSFEMLDPYSQNIIFFAMNEWTKQWFVPGSISQPSVMFASNDRSLKGSTLG